jgi:hypothetical protein
VAAREVLYLATTLTGLFACPVFLLLDLSTVWGEAPNRWLGAFRVACYLLTPHNYVAFALASRFRRKTSGGSGAPLVHAMPWTQCSVR